MVKETRKIWGNEDVAITATCIRVPVMRAHAESINLEFDRPLTGEGGGGVDGRGALGADALSNCFTCSSALLSGAARAAHKKQGPHIP